MIIKIMCMVIFILHWQLFPIISELNNFSQALNQVANILEEKNARIKVAVYHLNNGKIIELIKGDMEEQNGIDVIVNAANKKWVHYAGGGGTAGAIEAVFPSANQMQKGSFTEDLQARYGDTLKANGTLGEPGKAYIGKLPADIKLYTPKKPGRSLYELGYRYMISAVGAICNEGEDVKFVADAYRNSLIESESSDIQATSILFPRISAGVFGCPLDKIDELAVKTVVDYLLADPKGSIKTVYFIFWPGDKKNTEEAIVHYKALLDKYVK